MHPIGKIISLICILVAFLGQISGHGMLLEPPNRSSLWRFDHSAPPNYDDDQNFCGGMTVQWEYFEGKCGVCGDRYDAPHPQDNENTGKYGRGKVVRTYSPGSVIDVTVNFTTSHLGYFSFSLCILEDSDLPESGEECFQPLVFTDNSNRYYLPGNEGDVLTISTKVHLPQDLSCDRCVLRWHYHSGWYQNTNCNIWYVPVDVGNNWGQCDDGTEAEGCGPQETFRSCADISIL